MVPTSLYSIETDGKKLLTLRKAGFEACVAGYKKKNGELKHRLRRNG